MVNYITNKAIGVDESTGLSIELRVKELNIDASNRKITIRVDKCLVSPTGVEMKLVESIYYNRFGDKYLALEESQLGLGIKQMLNLDLDVYPNLQQN